jgi:hypothetical protein
MGIGEMKRMVHISRNKINWPISRESYAHTSDFHPLEQLWGKISKILLQNISSTNLKHSPVISKFILKFLSFIGEA